MMHGQQNVKFQFLGSVREFSMQFTLLITSDRKV